MQEITKGIRTIRTTRSVFFAALSLAFLTGWLIGLAPEQLGALGKLILYGVSMPACLGFLVFGLIRVIKSSSLSGIPSGKDSVSYVLSPEDLARWRSIKRGMDRHEVTAILGQPDGPPRTESVAPRPPLDPFRDIDVHISGKVCYAWGQGRVWFEPNAGPVVYVKIPEYI